MTLNIALGVVPLMGPGGANAYQKIVGAHRTPTKITLNWTEDADAATATPTLDGYHSGTTRKHVMVTLNTTNGSALGFYISNGCITGARPVQTGGDGINRIAVEMTAYTGATTTSELTLSALRIGHA